MPLIYLEETTIDAIKQILNTLKNGSEISKNIKTDGMFEWVYNDFLKQTGVKTNK